MHPEPKHRKGRGFALGMAMGIPLGIPIGIAMDNLAIGPAIGVAIGAGLGAALESAYLRREKMQSPEQARKNRIILATVIGLLVLSVLTLTIIYISSGNP